MFRLFGAPFVCHRFTQAYYIYSIKKTIITLYHVYKSQASLFKLPFHFFR